MLFWYLGDIVNSRMGTRNQILRYLESSGKSVEGTLNKTFLHFLPIFILSILDYYHNIQSGSALNIQWNFKKKIWQKFGKTWRKNFLADSYTTQKLKIQASVALLSQWNYCLIVKRTIKLHLNSTSTKQSSFIAPIKHISSNCIISTLFHYLTIAQSEMNLNGVRHSCRWEASKVTI